MSKDPKVVYADIIGLPHHSSTLHAKMSMKDRAAQFSPFAALTGYEDVITETARLTNARVELDESQKLALDEKLRELLLVDSPVITLTYFRADKRKKGGEYVDYTGTLKKIDEMGRCLIFEDGTCICISDVMSISSDAADF